MENNVKEIHELLIQLHQKLRKQTYDKYHRINPFYEDLFDWKERGEFFFGKGKNITVYNTCTIVGDVTVGENTWIGPYSSLDGNGGLVVGKFCSISAGVHIITHDSAKWALSGGKAMYDYAPIKIGDFCFIGTNAVITKGVNIGNHCLIGAGAVVTNDIPDFSITVGVPAKVIGKVKITGEKVEYIYDK